MEIILLVIVSLNLYIALKIEDALGINKNTEENREEQNTSVAEVLAQLNGSEIIDEKARDAVRLGVPFKWELSDIQGNIKLLIFARNYDGDNQRMNVYYGRGAGRVTYTVSTTLKHPYKGRGSLHRKGITKNELKGLFKNPRAHTDKGYYKK